MWQLVSDITAWETKAGGSPQVQGQLLNIARSCLKKKEKEKPSNCKAAYGRDCCGGKT